MEKTTEDSQMPKRQKNMMLDEGLCELVEEVQRIGGYSFTRVVTAGLLQLFFDGLTRQERGLPSIGFDSFWMRCAVAIEKAETTIDDLPGDILDNLIAAEERWLKEYVDTPDSPGAERTQQRLKDFQDKRGYWKNNIKDLGGPRNALLDKIRGSFPPPEALQRKDH